MRRKFVWFDRKPNSNLAGWVPIEELPRRGARLQIVSDSIPDAPDGVKSMADGKHYTSKSRLRAEYRARGFEEAGNERKEFDTPKYEPPSAIPDILRALDEHGVG